MIQITSNHVKSPHLSFILWHQMSYAKTLAKWHLYTTPYTAYMPLSNLRVRHNCEHRPFTFSFTYSRPLVAFINRQQLYSLWRVPRERLRHMEFSSTCRWFKWLENLFSRVHALSVRPLVGLSVCRSVGLSVHHTFTFFYQFYFF